MKNRLSLLGTLVLLLVLLLVILLSNVSILGREVEGCPEGCAQPAFREHDTLRVLSLNILHGRPDFEKLDERLAFIAAEISRLQVDLALLQEVSWTRQYGNAAAYLGDRTGMNSAYLHANGNRRLIGFEEGVMVLSRYPLVVQGFGELLPRAGFFEHRVVLHTVARTPLGAVDLYVTHLTNGPEQINQGQADSLLEYVTNTAQHTALVAGDFNAGEEATQMRDLRQVWTDAFRSLNPFATGHTCCIQDLSAPEGASLSRRIDYIFLVPAAGENLGVSNAQVVFNQPLPGKDGYLWASDHAGVLVEIEY